MLPKEIWIAGMQFLLKSVKSSSVFGTWGYVVLEEPATVMLNEVLDPQLQRETLLHEIIHAIDKLSLDPENCMTMALNRPEYPRLMEVQVTVFSRMLWMTMTDPRNKEAMDWMLRRADAGL
jgi:hypothetical protein